MTILASVVAQTCDTAQVRYCETSEHYVIVCPHCNEMLCDVEDGDTVGLLARVVVGHLLGKECDPCPAFEAPEPGVAA